MAEYRNVAISQRKLILGGLGSRRMMMSSMRMSPALRRDALRATFGGLENIGSCAGTLQTRL